MGEDLPACYWPCGAGERKGDPEPRLDADGVGTGATVGEGSLGMDLPPHILFIFLFVPRYLRQCPTLAKSCENS